MRFAGEKEIFAIECRQSGKNKWVTENAPDGNSFKYFIR